LALVGAANAARVGGNGHTAVGPILTLLQPATVPYRCEVACVSWSLAPIDEVLMLKLLVLQQTI
jgi:hypothetical protein